jgi:hypothetical protein
MWLCSIFYVKEFLCEGIANVHREGHLIYVTCENNLYVNEGDDTVCIKGWRVEEYFKIITLTCRCDLTGGGTLNGILARFKQFNLGKQRDQTWMTHKL